MNSFGVMVRVRVEIRVYVKTVLIGRKTVKTQETEKLLGEQISKSLLDKAPY